MRHLLTIIALILLSHSLQAAKVVISGVTKKHQSQLEYKLKPRLKYISKRQATSWRADDAAFYLKRILVRQGYPDAEVTWGIDGDTIQLQAQLGQQLLFGALTSNSQSLLTDEQLRSYFFQPVVDDELVPPSKAPFIAEYMDKGADNITNYLKSIGYWDAQVTATPSENQPKPSRVNIDLSIQSGPLHTLDTPSFSGIPTSTHQALNQLAAHYHQQPATTENIKALRAKVESFFKRSGYHFAAVTLTAENLSTGKHATTHLSFSISPGQRYQLDRVRITGNQHTQKRRIQRFYKKLRRKTYDGDKVDEATDRLLNTGIFSNITVTPQPKENAQLDLLINLEEGDSIITNTYIGSDSYQGLVLGMSYTDLNFAGKMWQLQAKAEYSDRELFGELGVTEPFFAGEPISFNTRLFAIQHRPDGYQSNQLGLQSSWTWEKNTQYSIRAYLGGSYVSTSSSQLTPAQLGPTNYLNTRAGILQNLDLRDDPILPQKGYNGQLLTELGSIAGSEQTAYFKLENNNSYRIPTGETSHLLTRLDLGAIAPANSRKLPIDQHFFSGGANSLRSFEERGLGPLTSTGIPLGGEAYWVGGFEWIKKINDPFHLSVFYDVGQVYENFQDLNFSDPRQAIGIGARIHLPIGPIRFEYGRAISPQENEPTGTFHFSIGASF